MEKIDYVEIGKRVKVARKRAKLTQEKLSEKVEVAPSYISEIERGTSICSLAVIVKIADVLELNLDNLICGINESNVNDTFKELLNRIPKEKHKLFINLCGSIADTLSEK
jgi:transcriptional regulator with XRE-family HTH domain